MAKVKAPSFKKPQGMKRLPTLGRKEKLPPLPDLDAGPERIASFVDDELARLTSALGNERLAKRLLKMKKEKYPDATLPELVLLEWLTRKRYKFEFQVWLLGGRIKKNGQVVDTVVDVGTGVIIIEVQGNYFHNRPGMKQRDEAQRLALKGLHVWGKKVSSVVELWESRLATPIASRREQAMQLAMQGMSIGP
jgi:hypothetical protein